MSPSLLRGACVGAFLLAACADSPSPLYSQSLAPDTARVLPIRVVVLAGDAIKYASGWWDGKDVYQNERALCVKTMDFSAGYAQGREVQIFIVTSFMAAKTDSASPIKIFGLKCPGPTLHTHPPSNCVEVPKGTGKGQDKAWNCERSLWHERNCLPSDSTSTRDGSPGDMGALHATNQPFGIVMCGRAHIGYYFPTEAPNHKALPIIPDLPIPRIPEVP